MHLEQEPTKLSIKTRLKNLPRWIKWVVSAVLLVGILIAVFAIKSQNTPMPVNVSEIVQEDIERSIFASGRLESVNEQEFFTPVDSTLMELHVELGDRVKQGDIMGRLDTLELSRRYQTAVAALAGKEAELARAEADDDSLNLKAAQAEYEQAKNHFERMEKLYAAGGARLEDKEAASVELARAESTYQQALIKLEKGAADKQKTSLLAQVDLARQEVMQAKERLDMATFTAQHDGVVTFIGAKQGNRVMEGTELLIIADDRAMEVTANINEIDAGNLKVGQPVNISCLALPGREYSGEIIRIGEAAIIQNNNSGQMVNIPVTIELKGDLKGLKIGYSVDLAIKSLVQKEALIIPAEAIISKDDKKIVYVVKDGVAKERAIKTEIGNEVSDIVISGLKIGEKVVINPNSMLKDGQKVTINQTGAEK